MHSTVIFLGPSLDLQTASSLTDADILGPVAQGDIYKQISLKRSKILIIDGYFERTIPVWHREILDALNVGITVVGASSMGALRAAELEPYGMIGVGQVFEWYRDSLIDGDDEVALLHGGQETGYVRLSEPLVNIRFGLNQALEKGCISKVEAESVLDNARDMYFGHRTLHDLTSHLDPVTRDALREYLRKIDFDVKRQDAIAAIRGLDKLEKKKEVADTYWFKPNQNRIDDYLMVKFLNSVHTTEFGQMSGRKLIERVRSRQHAFVDELAYESERFFMLKAIYMIVGDVTIELDEFGLVKELVSGHSREALDNSVIEKRRGSEDELISFFLKKIRCELSERGFSSEEKVGSFGGTSTIWTKAMKEDFFLERRVLVTHLLEYFFPSLLENKESEKFKADAVGRSSFLPKTNLNKIVSAPRYRWMNEMGPSHFGYRYSSEISMVEHLICNRRLTEVL